MYDALPYTITEGDCSLISTGLTKKSVKQKCQEDQSRSKDTLDFYLRLYFSTLMIYELIMKITICNSILFIGLFGLFS